MEYLCSYQGCLISSNFLCSCKEPSIFLCTKHSITHCQEQGNHNLLSVYISLNFEEKQKFVYKTEQRRKVLNNVKSALSQSTNDLISCISAKYKESIQNIMNEQNKLILTLQKVISTNEVNRKDYSLYQETYDYDVYMDNTMFENQTIKELINNYYSIDFLNAVKLIQIPSAQNLTKSMVFFLKSSKTLVNLNIQNSNLTKAEVRLDNALGSNAGWCRLPDNRVFHYGGQKSSFSRPQSYTYIIDIGENDIRRKADGLVKKYNIGPCAYHDNSVYVFGGSSIFSVVSNSERFNVETNLWTCIEPLPNSSNHNSTVVINDQIYLTGENIGALKYNILENSYSEELLGFDGCKVIYSEGNNIFISYANRLTEKNDGRWSHFPQATVVPQDTYLVSYPVKHENFIYFLLSNDYLYKFDIGKKELTKLGLIRYRN